MANSIDDSGIRMQRALEVAEENSCVIEEADDYHLQLRQKRSRGGKAR